MTNIANLVFDEQLIVVKSDSPFKTIEDVVAGAKKRPGEILVGGTMPQGTNRMCTRFFEKAANIKFRYVPFNSGGECITGTSGRTRGDDRGQTPGEFVPQWRGQDGQTHRYCQGKTHLSFPRCSDVQKKI